MSQGAAARRKGRSWQSATRDWWCDQAGVVNVFELGGAGASCTDFIVMARAMLSVEAKNHRAMDLAGWLDQAVEQAPKNSIPVVHHKRRGKGDVGESYVTLRACDLARLLGD